MPNSSNKRNTAISKDEIKRKICDQMNKFIKGHNITKQAQFAKSTGLSKSTVSKIFKPTYQTPILSIPNAYKIATAYGITFDFIYGNSDAETMQEGLVNILERHLSPSTKIKTLHGNTYSIPTIKLSTCFADYFKAVWAARTPSLSSKVSKTCLQQAKSDFSEALKNDTIGENDVEYVLIPLSRLVDEQQLNDLGINPESIRD